MKILIIFVTLRVLSNSIKSKDSDVHVMSFRITLTVMLYGIISRDLGIVLETSFMLLGVILNK